MRDDGAFVVARLGGDDNHVSPQHWRGPALAHRHAPVRRGLIHDIRQRPAFDHARSIRPTEAVPVIGGEERSGDEAESGEEEGRGFHGVKAG